MLLLLLAELGVPMGHVIEGSTWCALVSYSRELKEKEEGQKKSNVTTLFPHMTITVNVT